MDRERAWAEAEAKEKAKIARISAKAGGRAKTEVAERVRAWSKAEVEAKEKSDITRFTAQASEKAKAEAEERARAAVRERENAAKSAVE